MPWDAESFIQQLAGLAVRHHEAGTDPAEGLAQMYAEAAREEVATK